MAAPRCLASCSLHNKAGICLAVRLKPTGFQSLKARTAVRLLQALIADTSVIQSPAMSMPSASPPVNSPIGKISAVIEPLSKAGKNLVDARRYWANKFRDYSRSASENSDEWAESHLWLISFIAAGAGIILGGGLGGFFALP